MFFKKIGKKISETLFYSLKKDAIKRIGESEQWFDTLNRNQFVELYRKRMDELEYFQRSLLKVLVEETGKEKGRQKLHDSIKNSLLGNDKIFYKGMQTDLKEGTIDNNNIMI